MWKFFKKLEFHLILRPLMLFSELDGSIRGKTVTAHRNLAEIMLYVSGPVLA